MIDAHKETAWDFLNGGKVVGLIPASGDALRFDRLKASSHHTDRWQQTLRQVRSDQCVIMPVSVCLHLFSPTECAESALHGSWEVSEEWHTVIWWLSVLVGVCRCSANWPFGGTCAQNDCRFNCIDRLGFLIKVPYFLNNVHVKVVRCEVLQLHVANSKNWDHCMKKNCIIIICAW